MQNVLNEAIDIIVKNFAPDKIILFGSRATGMANQDSDHDLWIIKSDLQHKRKTAQDVYKALIGLQFSVDVIVETPEKFEEFKTNPFLIYRKIAENGEILYEKQWVSCSLAQKGQSVIWKKQRLVRFPKHCFMRIYVLIVNRQLKKD